jgi:hypothetical protein
VEKRWCRNENIADLLWKDRSTRSAVALDMLVEPNARSGLGQDRCERGLADLKRITPQVIAVQLDPIMPLSGGLPIK